MFPSQRIGGPPRSPRELLKGKSAVVTGSTSGIGLGIAEALAAAGADVLLNGFGQPAEIDRVRRSLAEAHGVRVSYSAADMSKPAEIDDMIAQATRDLGGRRYSRQQRRHPAHGSRPRVSDRALGCDHRHQPLGCVLRHPGRSPCHGEPSLGTHRQHRLRARARRIRAQGRVRRGEAWSPRPDQGRRARDGQVGRDLQCHLPGLGADPSCRGRSTPSSPRRSSAARRPAKLLGEKQPSLEFATPEQIGGLAVFLCSDAAAQIRGAALPVDGGWTAQ